MADDWVLDFSLSAQRWDAGVEVLVFKGTRGSQGAVPVAIRSHPWTKKLRGRVVSVSGSYDGWEAHPAAQASSVHYGYPPTKTNLAALQDGMGGRKRCECSPPPNVILTSSPPMCPKCRGVLK